MDNNITSCVASTIWSQLKGTTNMNILGSWGIKKLFYFYCEKVKMNGLVLNVNGKLYSGHIFVGYDESSDTYELYRLVDGVEPELWQRDIHFDELGRVIDKHVENPKGTFKY